MNAVLKTDDQRNRAYPIDFKALSDTSTGFQPHKMVSGIKRGDTKMESAFCQQYYASTFKILRSYTRDTFRAEDMTHEVLLKVLIRLRSEGIDHPERLTSFVHQTARFTFIGWYRQSDRIQLCESMDDRAGDCSNGETEVLSTEQASLMNQLIEEMEVPRDREVLYRRYFCDEPKQSICESLTLTPPHFDRVISRARRRLRQLVDTKDDEIRQALVSA